MTRRYVTVFTPAARADLRELATYLVGAAGRTIAEQVIDGIERRIAALDEFPARGVVPGELESLNDRSYRQIVVGKIRVIYRVADSSISILLIADGRRDMQTLLRQRLLNPPDWPR